MPKPHRFLKPDTMRWLKSKGALNEAEAAEVFADLEAFQKKVESLQKSLNAKIMFINNGWEEERFVLQAENERLQGIEKALQDFSLNTFTRTFTAKGMTETLAYRGKSYVKRYERTSYGYGCLDQSWEEDELPDHIVEALEDGDEIVIMDALDDEQL